MKGIIALLVGGLIAVGCASDSDFPADTTTTVPTATVPSTTTSSLSTEPAVVFTVEDAGGCMMMGANCAGYRFWSDGSVEIYRADGSTGTAAEISGSIDSELVARVSAELGTTNLPELRSSLPEGECRGCYDGIDTTFTYETVAGSIPFASTEVELDLSVPLFAATADALQAARTALDPLPIQERSG